MEVEKRLSVEDLMKPRYKCISDYPGNNLYPVGCIIEDDYPHWGIDLFPHLFKKLEWWEERKESDLPKYIKYWDTSFFVPKDRVCLGKDAPFSSNGFTAENFQPATKKEFTEYLTLNK